MAKDHDQGPPDSADEQAAEWIVRQDGDGLNAAEQAAFDIWLSATPENRAAYESHGAIWGRYQALGAAGPVPTIAAAPYQRRRHADVRRHALPAPRRLATAAIAASLALLCVGLAEDWPTRLRADHVTRAGERRSVHLADGSTALLDGDSAIAFDQSGGRRIVRLLKGAAAFRVAPDRAHPFTVEANGGSVTALGTAFLMRRKDDAVELAVTEHSVRVRAAQGSSAIVREGEGVRFTPDHVPAPRRIDLNAATAWTEGKLVVIDRPLGEVVATIGRQRFGYWTVTEGAAAIRVNGVYDLDHPLAALEALETTMKLGVFKVSDRFIILSRQTDMSRP